MLSEDTKAWAALALRNLPQSALVELLRAFGGPADVLGATAAKLRNVVADPIASRVTAQVDEAVLARTHAWLEVPGHRLVAWGDPHYPQALLALGHSPPVLYYVGNPDRHSPQPKAREYMQEMTEMCPRLAGLKHADRLLGRHPAGTTVFFIFATTHRRFIINEQESQQALGAGREFVPASLAHCVIARPLCDCAESPVA